MHLALSDRLAENRPDFLYLTHSATRQDRYDLCIFWQVERLSRRRTINIQRYSVCQWMTYIAHRYVMFLIKFGFKGEQRKYSVYSFLEVSFYSFLF